MKPINIFALTRKMNTENLGRLERQMSGRKFFLTVKDWEIESLRKLIDHLQAYMPRAYELLFYYSFQIPKLGKEFDLLRISADTVINIELKSNAVPDEQVRKQLAQNRYYLATLGLNIRSYTYISGEDRLLRLTGGGNIIEASWDTLCEDLNKQQDPYTGDIEKLFREESYIISPHAQPERFLQKEYFLTSQQKDIEKRILKVIKENGKCFQGFCGLPGTGKTLLLYDLAMALSERSRVAIFHCGSFSDELRHLDGRLKRIDFLNGLNEKIEKSLDGYSAVLVDEAHKLNINCFQEIIEYAGSSDVPVIFCYDSEEAIEQSELGDHIVSHYYELPEYIEYNLTNRIRANSELSAFIQCLMRGSNYNHRKDYPSVDVAYVSCEEEAKKLLEYYQSNGYTFIYDSNISKSIDGDHESYEVEIAGRHEYDKVVMIMDSHFIYREDKGLCSDCNGSFESPVRKLFHGLNRAKSGLAIVIAQNEQVFEVVLSILQGQGKNKK